MHRLLLALTIMLAVAPKAQSADFIKPDPVFSPERSITIQLNALMRNDYPAEDTGIRQAWEFAHPDNKRATGPLPRFTRMIKGPQYNLLLDHVAHEIDQISDTEVEATFIVRVQTRTGKVFGYLWTARKVTQGEHAGAWMTIMVSPPKALGDAT